MSEKAIASARKPVAEKESSIPHISRTDVSQSQDSPAGRILFLQRTIGNQAVQRLIRSGALQAKLRIGQPGDVYEQEADRVADAVMRMPKPGVQRQVEPEEEEETLQAKPLAEEITPLVQRQVEPEEEEEELQAKATSGHLSEVTPYFESHIHSLKGGSQPLPESERTFFEPRFGRDFSKVRVHTDTQAAESARAVNARAFTMGQDVIFGAGQYAPGASEGRRLMAHELVHVVQQKSKPEKGRDIQTKPATKPRFESVVLKDIPFDSNPRRELFFEADVLKRLGDKLADVRLPDPWGPDLMWTSNFRRDVYRKLMGMKPTPKTASLAVDFIKRATSEESSLVFAVVRTSLVLPPIDTVEPVNKPESKESAPVKDVELIKLFSDPKYENVGESESWMLVTNTEEGIKLIKEKFGNDFVADIYCGSYNQEKTKVKLKMGQSLMIYKVVGKVGDVILVEQTFGKKPAIIGYYSEVFALNIKIKLGAKHGAFLRDVCKAGIPAPHTSNHLPP